MDRLLGLFLFLVAAFGCAGLFALTSKYITFAEALIATGSIILALCLVVLAIVGIAFMCGALKESEKN